MLAQYGSEFLSIILIHFLAVVSPGPDFAVAVRQSVRHGRRVGIWTALGIGAGISVHVVYTLLGISALLRTTPWAMTAARWAGAAYLLWLGIQFLRSTPPATPEATAHSPVQGELAPLQDALTEDVSAALTPGDMAAPGADRRDTMGPVVAGGPSVQSQETRQAAPLAATQAEHAVAEQSARRAFWVGFMTNATNPKATLFFLAVFTTVVSATTPLWVQGLYGFWMCVGTAAWFVVVSLLFSRQDVRRRFLAYGHWFERIMGVLLLAFALKLLLS